MSKSGFHGMGHGQSAIDWPPPWANPDPFYTGQVNGETNGSTLPRLHAGTTEKLMKISTLEEIREEMLHTCVQVIFPLSLLESILGSERLKRPRGQFH